MRTEDLTAQEADLLAALRGATAPAHEGLDSAFGSLDLSRREEQARFLAAHAIGLAPLFPVVRHFAETVLGQSIPDYPAMLQADLAELGMDAARLAALPTPDDAARGAPAPDAGATDAGAAGTCYVVAGSRLGMTVIRREGYWGRAHGTPSRYMEDEAGHGLWKALVPWLKAQRAGTLKGQAAVSAARSAFATFAQAFDLAQGAAPAPEGDVRG